MACVITIKLGKEKEIIIKDVEESILTGEVAFTSPSEDTDENRLLANIVTAIKQAGRMDEVKSKILNHLKSSKVLDSTVDLNNLDTKGNYIPNANAKYLIEHFPELGLPEDVEASILLLDKMPHGQEFGRTIGPNGKEIFIVRNTRPSVLRLANFLKNRALVKGKNKVINNFEESLKSELKEIADKEGMSVEDLLVSYLENRAEFQKLSYLTAEGRTPRTVLNEAHALLLNCPGLPKYDKKTHQILNEFVSNITLGEKPYVDINKFFKYVKASKFLSHITSIKQFVETFNKKNGEINLNEWEPNSELEQTFKDLLLEEINFDEESNGFSSFVTALFRLKNIDEPALRYEARNITKSGSTYQLMLKSKFPTLGEVQGFTYESFKTFGQVGAPEGSYTIYSHVEEDGNTYYYPSRFRISDASEAVAFSSEADARAWARERTAKQTLRVAALGDFKQVVKEDSEGRSFLSSEYYPIGTIISSLDAHTIKYDNFIAQERELLDGTMDDFKAYLNSLDLKDYSTILEKINNPEKAIVFLSKLNEELEPDDRSNESLLKIADEVANLETKYYYIRKRRKGVGRDGEDRYYFVPYVNEWIENRPSDQRVPVIAILDQVAEMMKTKFGVPVEVLTQTEINNLQAKGEILEGQEIDEGTKAFIHNGIIYVNSTYATSKDLFHEYSHLFMGVIKARNPEWYKQTLDFILANSQYAQNLLKKKMETLGRSYYDAAEEVFADLYGTYLEDRLPQNMEKIFDLLVLKETQHSIFDLADNEASVKDFFQKSNIFSLFRRFSSSIAVALRDGNSFVQNPELILQRKKQNWLEKQLRLYNEQKAQGISDQENEGIKEDC